MSKDDASEVFAAAHTGDTISPEVKGQSSAAAQSINLASSASQMNGELLQRKGFLDRVTVIKHVNTPLEYGTLTKWMITLIVAGAAAIDPISSTIFYPALPELATDFDISPTIANLSVALAFLPTAICPLWWSFLSESRGRRMAYLISLALCLVFNTLSAKSSSIGALIAMRLLSSGTGCSVTAVGAGTVADIWEPSMRGKAMGIFYLGPLLGPAVGPVIGGALTQAWDWRATQWFLAIMCGACLLVILFCLPETLGSSRERIGGEKEIFPCSDDLEQNEPRNVHRQSFRSRFQIGGRIIVANIIDPLRILVYLRFPAILLPVYLASVSLGMLVVWSVSIQAAFSKPPYDYSALIIGLLFIPFSMGLILASILGGRWSDYIMLRAAKRAGRLDEKGKLVARPGDRVRENAWLSIVLFSGGLLWYGWTVKYGVLWIVPGLTTTMLTELVPSKSASAVAVNALGRNLFSCIGGVVAQPLIGAVGQGWLFTALSVIIVAGSGVIWAMRRFSEKWRIELADKLAD
ncbi:MAG: hypothetical protein ASARMPREDX12_002275 [Alectoria sarmentosa]|nr:MAG: hypothetical protein ASARMPREDX12_002275 [Alectoria sarmentosa]